MIDQNLTAIATLTRLIRKIESGEVTVQSFSRHAILEEIEPKGDFKQFRDPGCYVTHILYRRNAPATDITVRRKDDE